MPHSKKPLIINSIDDVPYAAEQFLTGKILLMQLGELYTFIINPQIDGLAENLNILKGRTSSQYLTTVCSYTFILSYIDRERINLDFYDVGEVLSGIALIRAPVDFQKSIPFPCNNDDKSAQFLNFASCHPLLGAFQAEIERQCCPFALATSGNLHGAPSCVNLEEALALANVINKKARVLSMDNVDVIVVDIPSIHREYKGSFPIVSFENPSAIEILRFIEGSPNATYQYLIPYLKGRRTNTELMQKEEVR